MMYPFYIFMAALTLFLIYNYRQVIKEKLGYSQGDDPTLEKSVQELQHELRGTADAIIEQFEYEHQRMELNLLKAQEQIVQLEILLSKAGAMYDDLSQKHHALEDKAHQNISSCKHPEDQRIRVVLELANHGMDIHEISKATGIAHSEVRLLLNIGRKHRAGIIKDQ